MQKNSCLVLEDIGVLPSSRPPSCKGASMDQHLMVLTFAEKASTVHNQCSYGLSGALSPVKNAAAGIKDGESNERKTGDFTVE